MNYCCDYRNKDNLEYARAYIVLQKYENLLSLNDAMKVGTIFMDLYRPYESKKKDKC